LGGLYYADDVSTFFLSFKCLCVVYMATARL
jgi:hypothetical protein